MNSENALQINLIDEIVDSSEELMKTALSKVKFLSPKNQTVINAIKLCANHLADKSYKLAYDKEQFIKNFSKRIQ